MSETKRLKIVVGTNCLTEVQYPTYTNHCQFWFRLGRSYPDIDFICSHPARMSIDRMRNMTAKVALEVDADYVLFLDDDVIINPNYGLKQLLDCNADIAAGKVCVRGWPFNYMAFLHNPLLGGLEIQQDVPKTGIRDYDAVGFSFALVSTNILRRMEEPYFVTGINNTEDIYFCVKARQIDKKCSIRVNCDCECGHILWPEVLFEKNRQSYIKYFKEQNPELAFIKTSDNKDRGSDYLAMVKTVTSHEEKTKNNKVESGMRKY